MNTINLVITLITVLQFSSIINADLYNFLYLPSTTKFSRLIPITVNSQYIYNLNVNNNTNIGTFSIVNKNILNQNTFSVEFQRDFDILPNTLYYLFNSNTSIYIINSNSTSIENAKTGELVGTFNGRSYSEAFMYQSFIHLICEINGTIGTLELYENLSISSFNPLTIMSNDTHLDMGYKLGDFILFSNYYLKIGSNDLNSLSIPSNLIGIIPQKSSFNTIDNQMYFIGTSKFNGHVLIRATYSQDTIQIIETISLSLTDVYTNTYHEGTLLITGTNIESKIVIVTISSKGLNKITNSQPFNISSIASVVALNNTVTMFCSDSIIKFSLVNESSDVTRIPLFNVVSNVAFNSSGLVTVVGSVNFTSPLEVTVDEISCQNPVLQDSVTLVCNLNASGFRPNREYQVLVITSDIVHEGLFSLVNQKFENVSQHWDTITFNYDNLYEFNLVSFRLGDSLLQCTRVTDDVTLKTMECRVPFDAISGVLTAQYEDITQIISNVVLVPYIININNGKPLTTQEVHVTVNGMFFKSNSVPISQISVQFSDEWYAVQTVEPDSIIFTKPEGLVLHRQIKIRIGSTESNTLEFTFTKPKITLVTANVNNNNLLIINGENFGNGKEWVQVKLSEVSLDDTLVKITSNQMEFKLPSIVTKGKLTVTVDGMELVRNVNIQPHIESVQATLYSVDFQGQYLDRNQFDIILENGKSYPLNNCKVTAKTNNYNVKCDLPMLTSGTVLLRSKSLDNEYDPQNTSALESLISYESYPQHTESGNTTSSSDNGLSTLSKALIGACAFMILFIIILSIVLYKRLKSKKLKSNHNVHNDHNNIRIVYSNNNSIDYNRNAIYKYPNNRINNTKYTILNFIPKNLIEQFGRAMNIYFLFIGILQLFPSLTPVDPISTWGALVFIFLISATKEAFDDYNRAKRDKVANERVYQRIVRGQKEPQIVLSQDIQVGDIIYLPNNSEVPCDMTILGSSDPEGSCYVQTANLDGETDLKTRYALPETSQMKHQDFEQFKGVIECPCPNPDIYRFDSRIALNPPDIDNEDIDKGSIVKDWLPVSAQNLILQATHLRNTEHIYGMVVYTGNETKIGKNKMAPPTKWTKLDRSINRITIFIFCMQLFLVLIFGIIGDLQRLKDEKTCWYLDYDTSEWYRFIIIPLRFLLLNSMMIPISLKVTIDVIKYAYALFISWDLKMYHKPSDTPATANSTALSEDLGQIQHLFTDKTGTLTENIMIFSKCSINGQMYGNNNNHNSGSSSSTNANRNDRLSTNSASSSCKSSCDSESFNELNDPVLIDLIKSNDYHVIEFLKCLSLCHSVVPISLENNYQSHSPNINKQNNNNNNNSSSSSSSNSSDVIYKASSPDEEALVGGTAKLGVKFTSRTKSSIGIDVNGDQQMYQLLHTFEFTSDRKRMSVVLRDKISGNIKIITKGADEVIFKRISNSLNSQESIEVAQIHLEEFAGFGLRTLCIAQKEIDEQVYQQWYQQHFQPANTDVQDRQNRLSESYDLLEVDLQLLGITAIEDKLQDEVPQTIYCLRQAAIKVWMLTGDKYSTAIQIANSCNLIEKNSPIYTVGKSVEDQSHLGARPNISPVEAQLSIESIHKHLLNSNESVRSRATIVIEGHVLALVLVYNSHLLLEISKIVSSVICCRVTPNQKAQVVKLIKDTGKITLAIGDGGNDVSMIQEANVGVGISGREGLQASRAADYSIARFRYLQELILVHGRYSYIRSSFVANYSFYKSLFVCFIQILYQLFSGFAGTSFFNSFSLTTYNIVFTGLPVVGFILDKDLPESVIRRNPVLYRYCQEGRAFNVKVFVQWCIRALTQALLVFSITTGAYAFSDSGAIIDYDSFSMISFTAIIFIQSLTLYFESHTITWINHILIWGTIPIYFVCVLVLNAMPNLDMYSIMSHLFDQISFWASIVLIIITCIVPFICIQYLFLLYKPTIFEVIHQIRINNPLNGKQPYPSPQNSKKDTDRESLLKKSPSITSSQPNLPPYDEEFLQGHNLNNANMHNNNVTTIFYPLKKKKFLKSQKNRHSIQSFKEDVIELIIVPKENEDYDNRLLYDTLVQSNYNNNNYNNNNNNNYQTNNNNLSLDNNNNNFESSPLS
ncbi:P-type ATPase [Tieghemostelium lacteum]|uniref:P-type phospholipid transporter n=1 Tax=Tieghemostelium lacteum TaxID=361077 RepID=A0A151Z7S8_TIELA|nr:P-type ATPase [Tieghemostelium lacteum]|eukprot:KYQ90011.1 P-type ATPase [Tieghemostelium lacteum]